VGLDSIQAVGAPSSGVNIKMSCIYPHAATWHGRGVVGASGFQQKGFRHLAMFFFNTAIYVRV